jgi:hypothetical protein
VLRVQSSDALPQTKEGGRGCILLLVPTYMPSHFLAPRNFFDPFAREIRTRVQVEKSSGSQAFSGPSTMVDLERTLAVNFSYQGCLVQIYIRCHGSCSDPDVSCWDLVEPETQTHPTASHIYKSIQVIGT